MPNVVTISPGPELPLVCGSAIRLLENLGCRTGVAIPPFPLERGGGHADYGSGYAPRARTSAGQPPDFVAP